MKIYVVIDPLITDSDSWESNLPSMLHGYADANNLNDVTIEEISDLNLIKSLFQSRKIEDTDKFVFPNAWTSMTIYIKHWAENYNVHPEMIGLWSRGCYINLDEEYRPLGDRNWRKVHERSSFRCLDKSFFISEYHKEQFRIYVSKFVFPERLHIIPFPMDYLDLEMSNYKESFYKQDLVIFPWSKYSEFQEKIVYDFIRVFTNMKVLFAQEHAPMERFQLLNQIARSKVAFLPYGSPNIGKEIYECILLGAIPLVPDLEGFHDIVPAEFRYPPEWTQNIFNYSKYAPDLLEKIKTLVHDYDSYKPLLDATHEKLYKKYYDSEHIVKEIFGNDKRN